MATELIPRNALQGFRVGLSVSDSDDLERLGLSQAHAELAVGELARAVLVAGGSLVYGGRIKPSGFTQILMHEVHRYGDGQNIITLCLAAPEHRKLSRRELDDLGQELGTEGRLVCLDETGREIHGILSSKAKDPDPIPEDEARRSYSSLRRYMRTITDARVLIGGKLSGFKGSIPGIIEEAIVTIEKRQPLYVSAGFGGAAALVAQQLDIDDLSWAPPDFPTYPTEDKRIEQALESLDTVALSSMWSASSLGLDRRALHRLAASHRASEIASLVVVGLSRLTR